MNTVLIVEDEKMIRQGIKTMIQRSGVPVKGIIECNNGQMALSILESQEIDVMFTDIRMPKMDGIQLVREMQKIPNKPLTVAISGYDDFSYAVEMMRMGVREYILKPVERKKVKHVMEILEAEIEKEKNQKREINELITKQLKYYLVSQKPLDEKLKSLVKQLERSVFSEEYQLACLRPGQVDYMPNLPVIFLHEVEDYDVLIFPYRSKEENDLFLQATIPYGLSQPHATVSELKDSYQEAKRARKHAFVRGKNQVSYLEIKKEERNSATRKETIVERSVMEQIANKIGTDKYPEGVKELDKLYHQTIRGTISIDTLEQAMKTLMDTIMKTYQNVLTVEENESKDYYHMFRYENIKEYQKAFMQWLGQIHETIMTQFEDYKTKQKIQEAIVYIQENYDKDLNMAVVSNHISMNYSLFSYSFKQYSGQNFIHYLKNIRVKEAKRLLTETDLRVAQISQKVGYENEKHFMKIFKTVCGISPTEYRKNSYYSATLQPTRSQ